MGQDEARITAADFLTPPELAHLRLARHPAGRIGGVRLELASPAGRTRLVASYQQIPLRLLPVSFGAAQPSLVYLVNPTAGLMDGDAHLVHVTHRDQVEAPLTDWLKEAFVASDRLSAKPARKTK